MSEEKLQVKIEVDDTNFPANTSILVDLLVGDLGGMKSKPFCEFFLGEGLSSESKTSLQEFSCKSSFSFFSLIVSILCLDQL